MYAEIPVFIQEYLPIIVFFIVAVVVSAVLIAIPLLFSTSKADKNKTSPYECGFDPFSNARREFDVKFYLVAILFVIFDLEIMFLFPWAITLGKIGFIGFCSMMIFLLILTIGFIYEWKKGALEWE